MFCGGRRCKYEVPDNWRKEDMAVQGIFRWVNIPTRGLHTYHSIHLCLNLLLSTSYISFCCSHWVTDDLLAMSRPNSANIATTISEFKRLGIKSIVNVQVSNDWLVTAYSDNLIYITVAVNISAWF